GRGHRGRAPARGGAGKEGHSRARADAARRRPGNLRRRRRSAPGRRLRARHADPRGRPAVRRLVPRILQVLDAPVAREEGTRRGFPLRLKLPSDGGVALARGLLIGVLVTVLPSTTLGEVFEFATYIAFAVSPELRRRLARTIHHPLMTGFL